MDAITIRRYLEKLIDVDNEVYSSRMAFVFCMVLSALLWWIPIIGPAVAGYVCGRKTGSMVKGLFCSLIAGTLLLLMVRCLSALVLVHGGYPEIPAKEAADSLIGIVGSTANYLQTFYVSGTSMLDYSGLGITTAFGLIGGILSRQMRKEMAFLISAGATEGSYRPAARSMQLYNMNKEIGFRAFDDCMETQRMTTNENKDVNSGQMRKEAEIKKAPESRPVATTVQTVTTTVSGSPSATQTKEQGSPFVDILERTDRKKGS
jgi:triacylglycerol esterase/lipase EstA (alpha/beta hydrolase family)